MTRLLGLLGVLLVLAVPVRAAETPQRIVDRALATYDEMTSDPDFANLDSLLARARGVIIVPEMYKGGFIVGGEYGEGVLLARDAATGLWSPPGFVTLTSGSLGLQIGGAVSQFVLVIMTEEGIDAILRDKMTLGGDASVAAGPVGAGVDAQSTSDLNDDIYAYAKSEGLFAGASIEGAVIERDGERMRYYYGDDYSLRQVVFQRMVTNPGADPLRAALAGY